MYRGRKESIFSILRSSSVTGRFMNVTIRLIKIFQDSVRLLSLVKRKTERHKTEMKEDIKDINNDKKTD